MVVSLPGVIVIVVDFDCPGIYNKVILTKNVVKNFAVNRILYQGIGVTNLMNSSLIVDEYRHISFIYDQCSSI